MADRMQPTPRGYISGLFSDAVNLPLQYMSSPERTQQMQGAAQFLYGTGIPKTLERISYGDSLFSGAGGLGGTTRMRPETAEALMNVAPFAPVASRVANQAAMTAGRAGARYAERVVPQIMERGGLPAQLLGDISRGSVSPLDVYHGTPHTLPPTERNPLGEFDASKIGTGEGAQSFGYGIYTAENPAVAKEYMQFEGLPSLQTKVELSKKTRDFLNDYVNPDTSSSQWLKAAKEDAKKYNRIEEFQELSKLKAKDIGSTPVGGNLYKVDLPDEKIATMLDWDKPMSEQRNLIEKMRKALVGGDSPLSRVKQFELNDWLNDRVRLRNLHPQSIINLQDPQIVKRLSEAGIPGVKYLDELSRRPGASSMTQAQLDTRIEILKKDIDSGLGNQDRMKEILSALEQERASHSNLTRNFVVFPNEEKSMTILERNGMPATPIESPTYSDPFGNTIGSSIR